MPLPELLPWLLSLLLFLLLLLLLFIRRKSDSHEGEYYGEIKGRLNEIDRLSQHIEELRTLFLLPRSRGDIGETMLETLLRNWLPEENFGLQYSFANGYRADAVIHLGRYLVAVDAKFPLQGAKAALESGNSAGDKPSETPPQVKRLFLKHAKDIASKYIHPDEGTLQFALMYIPSEHIYYRCFVEDSSLSAEVLRQKIIPVSPSTLFLYIQTVAYGLRGFRFSQKAEQMLSRLYEIQTEMGKLERALSTSQTHLKNLSLSFDSLHSQSRRINSLFEQIEKP